MYFHILTNNSRILQILNWSKIWHCLLDAALVRPRPRQHGRSLSMSATHDWKDVVGPPLPLSAVWPTLHGRFPDQRTLPDSNQLFSTALNGGLSRQTGRTTLTNGVAASSLKAATLGGWQKQQHRVTTSTTVRGSIPSSQLSAAQPSRDIPSHNPPGGRYNNRNNAGWNISTSARSTLRAALQDVGHHPCIDNEGYILLHDQWRNQRKTNRQGVIKVLIWEYRLHTSCRTCLWAII